MISLMRPASRVGVAGEVQGAADLVALCHFRTWSCDRRSFRRLGQPSVAFREPIDKPRVDFAFHPSERPWA